jgi:hypothetical protein
VLCSAPIALFEAVQFGWSSSQPGGIANVTALAFSALQ